MRRRIFVFRVILTALSAMVIALIFYNSSLSAVDSSEDSGYLLEIVNRFLNGLGLPAMTEHLIRKTAHFVEYFILGVLLSLTYLSYFVRARRWAFLTLPTGLIVASCDEVIQLFSAGRSCEVRDVLLDFCGVLCAFAIVMLIIYFDKGKKEEKVYE